MRIYIFKGLNIQNKKNISLQDCDSREKSKLMDNEVASPVDDFNESSA